MYMRASILLLLLRFNLPFCTIVSKRAPPRDAPQKNDIYVNNNSQFLAQLSKAQKALDGG